MNVKHSLLIISISLLLFSLHTQAQQNPYNEVSIASPTAASLGKYADIPVNYHTGIPSISIPIYNVELGELSLPVSLSYHASGLRVMETAGWVGAGWSLNAGGVITRTVRGAPDERQTSSVYNQTHGYYSDFGYSKYSYYGSDGQNAGLENDDFISGKRDGEPDVFNFNVGGLSGKFYFRDDRTPIFEPQQNIRVLVDYTNNNSIQSFILTGPDGTRYHFGFRNNPSFAVPIEQTNPVNGKSGYIEGKVISSWYLNKIESADRLDSICLNYTAENYSYYSLSMFPIPYDARSDQDPNNNYEYSLIKNVVKGVRLTNIFFAKDTINFVPGATRQDLGDFSTAFTPDIVNSQSKVLDRIEVRGQSGYCKKFVFAYDYFVSTDSLKGYFSSYAITTDTKRLKLNSVQELSCDGTVSVPAHTFEYFTESVPRRLSFGQDHWGFANGVTTNTGLIPTYTENYFTTISGANREPAWPAMRGGTLKKISYPTGGSTTFDFEADSAWAESTRYTEHSRLSLYIGYGSPPSPRQQTFTVGANPVRMKVTNKTSGTLGNNNTAYFEIRNSSSGLEYSNTVNAGAAVDVIRPLAAGTYTLYIRKDGSIGTGDEVEANVYEEVPSTYARNELVGGLRIKTITHASGSSPDRVLSYSYNLANGRSSGILYGRPTYVQVVRSDEFVETKNSNPTSQQPPSSCSPNGCVSCDNGTMLAYQMSPSGIRPLASSQGNHIGYNEVKVSESGNGYSIFKYYGSDIWDGVISDVAIKNVNTEPPCSLSIPSTPAIPLQYEPLRGELKYEEHRTEAGTLLTETTYNRVADFDVVTTPGRINTTYGTAKFGAYYTLKAFRKALETTTKKTYSAGGTIIDSAVAYYESSHHFQPTRRLTRSSEQQNVEVKYKYAADFKPSSCQSISDCYSSYATAVGQAEMSYQQQKSICSTQACIWNNYQSYRSNLTAARRNYIDCRNNYSNPTLAGSYAKCRIDAKAAAGAELKPIYQLDEQNDFTPIEVTEWKNGKLTGATFTRFDYVTNPANFVYPNKIQKISLAQSSSTFTPAAINGTSITKDSRYADEVLLKYDYGNLVELIKKDGIINSYVWGYDRRYPVAKIQNVPYASANGVLVQNTIQSPSSDLVLRNELDKIRQNFPSAMVTTYTYMPLFGVSSISDQNNKPAFYEYDKLGRLYIIRDKDQNIQKVYTYKYQSSL